MDHQPKLLSKSTAQGEPAFPWKLHSVLEAGVAGGFDHIVSWEEDNVFRVHDPIQFENTVMKRFFNQTQYKSFQRQLNMYGFTRIGKGNRATSAYKHPCFIRGNPDACRFMVRIKIKNKGLKSKTIVKTNATRIVSNQHLHSLMQYNAEILSNIFPSKCAASSSLNNHAFEPTPIYSNKPFRALNPSRATMSPEIIPRDTNLINSHRQEDQARCGHVELDLDTIFDDDAHAIYRNNNANTDDRYNNYTKPIHIAESYHLCGYSKARDIMRNSITSI